MAAELLAPPPKVIVNPFLDEYTKQEIRFFGVEKFGKKFKGQVIQIKTLQVPFGRFPDYLNENFRIDGMSFPNFWVDNTMWMSLTYLEMQSHWVPIQLARGDVGVLGLGIGYYVLRIMQLNDVDSIDIYEQHPGVVKYFKECFKDRCGFHKLNFIMGDARKKMRGKTYDFVYSDIYLQMLGDGFESDITLFQANNDIDCYFPWGLGKVFWDAIQNHDIMPSNLPRPMQIFFKFFLTTEIEMGKGETMRLHEHPNHVLERPFVTDVLKRLDWTT